MPKLSSLHARLILLVLLTLVAPVALFVHTATEQRQVALAQAEADAMRLSELAAAEHRRLVESGHKLLAAFAQLPAVRAGDAACSASAASLLAPYAEFADLSAARPNGDVFCSGKPLSHQANWSGETWFKQVLAGSDLMGGDYLLDRETGAPALILSHSVPDATGRLQAVAAVSLELDWLVQFSNGFPGAGGRSAAIFDRAGNLLIGLPGAQDRMGKPAVADALLQAIQAGGERGVAQGRGADGADRLYSYLRLPDEPQGAARYVVVSVPTAVAYGQADRQLWENLGLLAVAAVLALAAAWWAGQRLVLEPVRALLRATGSLRGRNFAARAGPPYPAGELGGLARAFDEMGAALEVHEEERQRAEAALRSEIAERQAAEQALQKSENRYQTLANLAPVGITRFDPAGKCLYVNQAWCDITGLPAEQALSGDWRLGVHPEDQERVGAAFRGAVAAGQTVGLEHRCLAAGGTVKWVYRQGCAEQDAAGRVTGWVGTLTDITELKSAHRELQRYAEEQATLYGVSAALAAAPDAQALLGKVLEMILPALDADAGWVLVDAGVISRKPSVLVCTGVAHNYILAEAEVGPENCPICEQMLKAGRLQSRPQLMSGCPRLPPAVQAGAGIRCHAGIPLVSGQRALGILSVGWRDEHALSAAEEALLEGIGRQVSVALERAELFAAATRRARRMVLTNTIGQALAASLDLDCVIEGLLDNLMQAVDASAVLVALWEDAEDCAGEDLSERASAARRMLVVRGARGAGTADLVGRRTDAQDGLVELAPACRRPSGEVTRLPLAVHGRAIGVLELAMSAPNSLDEEDRQLLAAVAAQASVSIENALLYRREREQYRRLEESGAQLIQAEKSAALGRLAAALAHEINNPLQSLRGHIELLADFPLEPEERGQYLRVAQQEIVRLSDIAHRVLNFYRPSPARPERADVNELVERTVRLAGKQLEQARIRVNLNLQAGQPVLVVPDQLMQVFLNLLLNASQAIGQAGQIDIATTCTQEQVSVCIANDGPSIPPQDLTRIFEPFFTTRPGGSGLGLPIAQNIVHQHGGTIIVTNQAEGRGVVFTVRLPAAQRPMAREER